MPVIRTVWRMTHFLVEERERGWMSPAFWRTFGKTTEDFGVRQNCIGSPCLPMRWSCFISYSNQSEVNHPVRHGPSWCRGSSLLAAPSIGYLHHRLSTLVQQRSDWRLRVRRKRRTGSTQWAGRLCGDHGLSQNGRCWTTDAQVPVTESSFQ